MFSLLLCLFFYVYIVCVKSIVNLLQYSTDCVSWVPRLTLLDLQTDWIYEYAPNSELVFM